MGPEGRNTHLKFDGSCLKTTEKYFFYPSLTELNIYLVYELSSNLNSVDLTLENCLFGTVRLTKMQILISINIRGMVLYLIQKKLFYILMAVLAKI